MRSMVDRFFEKNRAEAKKVSIYEYDEERHMRQTRAEGYEEGEMIATARINQLALLK